MRVFFPALAGPPLLTLPPTYAAHRVWSGSTTKVVTFQPVPKKAAIKLWHRARDFDRQTKAKGKHGGAVGHAALAVLHTLIFDFLNHATGRLDPSYAAIARKANVAVSTVGAALARLRDLGILNWARRCTETWRDGRHALEQLTNAYGLRPTSQWRGYAPPAEPPAPAAGTWGDHPPLPDALAVAAAETGGMLAKAAALASDPHDRLAAALARLCRSMGGQKP